MDKILPKNVFFEIFIHIFHEYYSCKFYKKNDMFYWQLYNISSTINAYLDEFITWFPAARSAEVTNYFNDSGRIFKSNSADKITLFLTEYFENFISKTYTDYNYDHVCDDINIYVLNDDLNDELNLYNAPFMNEKCFIPVQCYIDLLRCISGSRRIITDFNIEISFDYNGNYNFSFDLCMIYMQSKITITDKETNELIIMKNDNLGDEIKDGDLKLYCKNKILNNDFIDEKYKLNEKIMLIVKVMAELSVTMGW